MPDILDSSDVVSDGDRLQSCDSRYRHDRLVDDLCHLAPSSQGFLVLDIDRYHDSVAGTDSTAIGIKTPPVLLDSGHLTVGPHDVDSAIIRSGS